MIIQVEKAVLSLKIHCFWRKWVSHDWLWEIIRDFSLPVNYNSISFGGKTDIEWKEFVTITLQRNSDCKLWMDWVVNSMACPCTLLCQSMAVSLNWLPDKLQTAQTRFTAGRLIIDTWLYLDYLLNFFFHYLLEPRR